MIARRGLLAGLALLALATGAARAADDPPPSDLLNAVLWMQRAVEYRASAEGAFALARLRLDEALADPDWTAAPDEQTGDWRGLPPAVIVDLDETLLDNSAYQAWLLQADRRFDGRSWSRFVADQVSTAVPGALGFAQAVAAKGVRLFYVSNRTAAEEAPTRALMARLGFPMGGDVDTFLLAGKRPDWGSAKGTRRAHVAREHRVLLNVGDNFGDFVDAYRGSEAERLAVYERHRARWGREWIMLPNPSYGSFETAPFGHDGRLPVPAQRRAKREVLEVWRGP